MDLEIKLTKKELKKISLDFRMVANRIIRTKSDEGISNLKRFLNYIDNEPIIIKFIQENNNEMFDIESIISNYPHLNYSIPDDSPIREISFIYQLLKYALEQYNNSYHDYYGFAYIFSGYSGNIQNAVDNFNSIIVIPFYGYIENYLTKLQIDMGDDENAKIIIHVQGDNYGHNIGASMKEMNINQNNSSFGVGVNQGEINTEKLAGTIVEADKRNIAEVAAEIQQLLEQLEKSYSTNTTIEKMAVASEAIKLIEGNQGLYQRIISALKAGSTQALAQYLNHPLASFVIAAFEDWQKGLNEVSPVRRGITP